MKRALGCAALVLVSSACKVGPQYVRPVTPIAPVFKELPPGNDQWKNSTPRDGEIRGNWWEVFGDPQLNALEESVSISNQSIKQVEAQYRVARALVQQNRAGYYPAAGAGPSATASGTGGRTGGPTTSFSIPFSASWEPDFWGRVRLAVESSTDTAQATAGDLQNARLSVQTSLATDYFLLHSVDMQERILADTITAYQKALTLTTNRYNGGVASKADVMQAQTQLATTTAQRTDLQVARAQYEHAIAVLTGQPPANLTIPVGAIKGPPPAVPVGVPSQLLERRPDLAAAERRVAAANAQVGLAETAYFPTLTLSGSLGLSNGNLWKVFTWPAHFWSMGPAAISQTLFDAGRRRAQMQQFEASYDAAIANYRQLTLLALQEVEDNLAALHILEAEAAQQDEAVKTAEQSLALELERYKGGTVSYLDVITTQTITLSNERTAVGILQRRMVAAVNLITGLGGGWNAANLPNPDQIRQPVAGTPVSKK